MGKSKKRKKVVKKLQAIRKLPKKLKAIRKRSKKRRVLRMQDGELLNRKAKENQRIARGIDRSGELGETDNELKLNEGNELNESEANETEDGPVVTKNVVMRMSLLGFLAVVILFSLAVAVFAGCLSSKSVEKYFVPVDAYKEYYNGLTEGQKVTGLRVFDFKKYFRAQQKGLLVRVFGAAEVEISEARLISDPDNEDERIYCRDDNVELRYNFSLDDEYLTVFSIVTTIRPSGENQMGEKQAKVVSYARVSYTDSKGNNHRCITRETEIDMTDAVFDASSPFFCARETFKEMVTLFESGRLKKYPDNPFIGLSDEAAPIDYESQLLKHFLDIYEEDTDDDESSDRIDEYSYGSEGSNYDDGDYSWLYDDTEN